MIEWAVPIFVNFIYVIIVFVVTIFLILREVFAVIVWPVVFECTQLSDTIIKYLTILIHWFIFFLTNKSRSV